MCSIEIVIEQDHILVLIDSVYMESATKIIRIMKSSIAKQIFKRDLEEKQKLRGWEF
jgi:hypothetical protein